MRAFFTLAAFIAAIQLSNAQDTKPGLATFYKAGRGAGFVTNDSSFSVNFQFRMQNRAIYNTESEDDPSLESMEMRVRRLRFKFTGFVLNPRLTYYIQLSFARGDMDWRVTDLASVNNSPNIVRDAIIYYQLTPRLRLGFGQTKLPGNRQRVISSGDQQFPERSIVNAGFNIDRDFGFFGWYSGRNYNLKGAITSGEGRNTNTSFGGLAYTGRLELLPLGRFSGNNDDMEGDLEREPTPKIALSGSYHYNDRAERQAGQTGNDIYEPRSLVSMEADFLMKYNGWSWYTEYMNRSTSNPITVNVDDNALTRAVVAGEGFLTQVGYLFRSNIEIAGRYAQTRPNEALYNNTAYPQYSDKINEQYELGFSRYFRGHRVKLQTSLMYLVPTDLLSNQKLPGKYAGTFQFEIGI